MGFSPGDFTTTGKRSLHWEGKSHSIVLWNAAESEVVIEIAGEEARKCLEQLSLLVNMHEENGL